MDDQGRILLKWYDVNRRELPWREDPTPYHVWLSEIMLQQTRVEAGREYYLRFLEELPDIESLANAPENVYMKLWEGLGYYTRVRNLHKAAVVIMEKYGGEMPRTADELQKLPGIGSYTAAAIASIAFGEKVVSVDGNLVRVFARVTEFEKDAKSPEAKKAAGDYYSLLQPEDRPGDFNQALMDLGATICLPNGTPLCEKCPWKPECLAHRDGRELNYPVLPEKRARRIEDRTVFLLFVGHNIVIHRRPENGLLAGLYEFPNVCGHLNEKEIFYVLTTWGISEGNIRGSFQPLGKAKHVFSHIEWHMVGYAVILDSSAELPAPLIAVSPEKMRTDYPIPSAFRFYQQQILRLQ